MPRPIFDEALRLRLYFEMFGVNLHRRSVLSLAAVLGGLLVIRPVAAFAWCGASSKSVDLASRIRARVPQLFCDRNMAAAVGDLYLEGHPEEADVECLLRLLTHDAEASSASFSSTSDIDTWLAWRIARDLRDCDVVVIAGWVLARSEARLCMLADPSKPRA